MLFGAISHDTSSRLFLITNLLSIFSTSVIFSPYVPEFRIYVAYSDSDLTSIFVMLCNFSAFSTIFLCLSDLLFNSLDMLISYSCCFMNSISCAVSSVSFIDRSGQVRSTCFVQW